MQRLIRDMRGELTLRDQKTVVFFGAVDVETSNRSLVIDAGGLGAAHCRWDGDHREHSTFVVKNVRVIDACCISVITDSLVKVIQAEKLVERCAGEIHSRKSAVDIQEAAGSPGGIDIEAVGIAPVVDSR
jgi:hypothetical protein